MSLAAASGGNEGQWVSEQLIPGAPREGSVEKRPERGQKLEM